MNVRILVIVGYNLFKTRKNDLVMIMDDPGGAQSSWHEHWHHPILTEDIIEKYLIKPWNRRA